jgi:hypothetical protein
MGPREAGWQWAGDEEEREEKQVQAGRFQERLTLALACVPQDTT